MRDLYNEGFSDALKEMDNALTTALNTHGTGVAAINAVIGHMHVMRLRTEPTHKSNEITFEDFLQSAGILHVIKGGN